VNEKRCGHCAGTRKLSQRPMQPRLYRRAWAFLLGALVAVVLIAVGGRGGWANRIGSGAGSFAFVDVKGDPAKPITVYTFCPKAYGPTSPIVFVMHGVLRNGADYRDQWIAEAERHGFLLIVPEFSQEHYPGGRMYNLGNMFDRDGNAVPEPLWTFSVIEHLFDHVREITGNRNEKYLIYGHSAGGQFVHRFVLFKPNSRLERAVAANAGWYTMPSDVEFPYGLKSSGVSDEGLKSAFDKKLVILLGDQDIDENDRYLSRTPQALEQGRHRFERGHVFFRVAKQEANRLHTELRWELRIAPGVGHDNSKMAPWGARALFEHDE